MTRALYRLGRFAVRRRRLVVLAWLATAVLLGVAAGASGGSFSDDFRVPGADSQAAIDLLKERFPEQAGGRAQIVMHVEEGDLTDPRLSAAIGGALTAVAELDHVSAPPALVPASLVSGPDRAGGATAMADVLYDVEVTELGEEALDELHAVLDVVREAGVQVEVGGDLAQYAAQPETGPAEALGVLAAVVILLFTFGSAVGMGLPIGIALFGLATGTALMVLLALVTEVSTTAPILSSMIGIGVGIDYALFVVTRHRQHLAEGMTVAEAAGRANATSGQAVIFAGGTVVIAICGLALAGLPVVTTMGFAAAIIVAVMVVASVTLLPALLGFAGPKLAVATLPWVRRREERQAARVERLQRLGGAAPLSRWERWAHHVSDHPWTYLVAGVAVLLLLAAPMLSMRLGQTDAGNAAPGSSLRRAYDLISEGFGAGFNGPLLVVVDAGDGGVAASEPLFAALQQDPAVALAVWPQVNQAGDTAVLTVISRYAPQHQETTALVHRLRDEVVPDALDGTGMTAYVSGLTAVFTDLSDQVSSRLPWFIGAVIGLSFILLMAVFRSVLVPLKAAVLNMLSIGAAYGVVVAVFQWGWLKDVIGLQETVPIVSFVPMFMFAILFGLSMDYEVFLLSRIREEYLHHRDSTRSVVVGLASTARVITSAALIMICVFMGFVFGDDPVVKMMGIGLATAVLVDATIVRVVLVPASMRLLGDANWWLPGWLDRLLPNIDVEGTSGLPEPERRSDVHPSVAGAIDADVQKVDEKSGNSG